VTGDEACVIKLVLFSGVFLNEKKNPNPRVVWTKQRIRNEETRLKRAWQCKSKVVLMLLGTDTQGQHVLCKVGPTGIRRRLHPKYDEF